MSSRRSKGRGSPVVLILLIITAAALLLSYLVNSKLNPILTDTALSRVRNIATRAINESVSEKIAEGTIDYDKLIYFEKNTSGEITALKTNMVEVNKVKSELINLVMGKISDTNVSDLAIPIGNLMFGDFFSGRGPSIPIKIVSINTANASFSNQFSEAGINQTRHQIYMTLEVEVTILLSGRTASTTVSSEVCIAETIIVGNVPQNYTYFAEAESAIDTAGLYSDLG